MKKILLIAGLLITLGNVGAGVVYACKCYERGDLICEGKFCWYDNGCFCSDDEIEVMN